MIQEYPTRPPKKLKATKIKETPSLEESKTPFPKVKLSDDVVIDEILHTLREEENAAHE